MDSPVLIQLQNQKSDLGNQASGFSSHENTITVRDVNLRNREGSIGVLEVFIHHAWDIHNICIYQKQDVYAKLCLTNNPDITVSTKIVNGGGKNPIFNEDLQLDVGQIDSSLKCEIWMLSRVRNYLEDQLLGFALVPLSQVIGNRRVTQELPLSSTDLFHSPAGFVQLSISYNGYSPNVSTVAPSSVSPDTDLPDSVTDRSVSTKYGNMEFPDLKILNENQLMVSEYYGIPSNNLDSGSSVSLIDCENHPDSKLGIEFVESFSNGNHDPIEFPKNHSSPDNDSSNGCASGPVSVGSEPFYDSSGTTSSPDLNQEKCDKNREGEKPVTDSNVLPNTLLAQSVVDLNIEPEQHAMQQQIVDMYMKSMQQFTESLAKMKLPMDIENGPANPDAVNSSLDQKLQASKSTGSRVFYGSRAFF